MCRWLVCGVDDTREARDAVRVAGRLADALGLRLQLVSVVDGDADGSRAAARAGATLDRVDRGLPEGAVHRVESGNPHECLTSVADELDADGIVVGSRGRSAVVATLRGSVSAQVVAAADRPVVVVPPGAADGFFGGPRATPCRIMCGIDESSNAGDAAAYAALLSRRMGAQLVLCHADPARRVATNPVEPPHALAAALERLPDPPEVRFTVESGNAGRGLATAAQRDEAEMIVVGAAGGRRRGPPIGSVTRGLLARSPCPVVVVPPRREPAPRPHVA